MRPSPSRLGSGPLAVLGALTALTIAVTARAQTSDDLFNDTVLHEIHLSVNSSDWAKLKANFQSNDYYPASIEWRGITVNEVGIRSRGLASRNDLKPGLRVDMNHYIGGQRFLGMRTILLDNVYRDVSLIRERIAMKFFDRFGFSRPREAHARVSVNGQYVGVYVITEELGEDFVRRAFHKPDSDEPDKGTLFEYHWVEEWHGEYLGPTLENYMSRFEPRTRENDPIVTLYSPIEDLLRTVGEVPTERFFEAVDPLLDLRQFITYLAVETFLVEYDGLAGFKGMANFYLYRPEDSKRHLLIPWDKDQTFYVANRDLHDNFADNILIRRALEVTELRRLFYETLAECARIAMERESADGLPWMERAIIEASNQIHDSVLADPSRWFGTEDFPNEIERMREFARTRPEFVTCWTDRILKPEQPVRECTAPDRVAPR